MNIHVPSPVTAAGVVLTWSADAAFQLGNALDALACAALDRGHSPP